MNRNFATFATMVCVGLLGLAQPVHLCAQQLIQPPEIKDASREAVKQLLNELWEPGPATRAAAEQEFAAISAPGQDVVLAFVANRLNDSQTRSALSALEASTSRDPKAIDGWLLKSYLHILVRDYDAGMMSLRSAKKAMDPAMTDPQKNLFFKRAGELMGYLQGPAPRLVNSDVFNSTVEALLADISDAEVQAFTQAAETIANQYADLRVATDESLDEEFERQANADAFRQATLTNENQTHQQTTQELNEQWKRLQEEWREREAQLSAELIPLQSAMSSMESQIYSYQLTLQNLYWDLSLAQNGPAVYPFTVQTILNQIGRVEVSLIQLQSSLQGTLSQYNRVRLQIRELQAVYNQQTSGIQKELKRIENLQKRNQNELTRLASGPRIAGGKRESRESRVAGLRTYIRLSPALLKQELLESME